VIDDRIYKQRPPSKGPIVEMPPSVTVVASASAFRTLGFAKQHEAFSAASMDVLRALLEAPVDLSAREEVNSLFAVASFVLTSKELRKAVHVDLTDGREMK
jgi:hypothetical protein